MYVQEGDMIIRVLVILVIVISLPAISTLQIPPKVMAQTPSEAARVLVDDVIHDLKSNDAKKAQVHLSILNKQLPTLVNSSSIQLVVRVLVDGWEKAVVKELDWSIFLSEKSVGSDYLRNGIIVLPMTSDPLGSFVKKAL
jgi:hypothetical protein